MSALTNAIQAFLGVLRGPFRLIGPEGAVWVAILAVPSLSLFAIIAGYTPFFLLAAMAGTAALGWRFRRGRLIHGLAVMGFMALIPLLPPALQGPTAAAGALNLALLAILPEQGVLSPGGLTRGLALLAQAGAVLWLVLAPAGVPAVVMAGLESVRLEGVRLDGVPFAAAAHGAALATLALLTLVRGDAIHRGLLWAGLATAAVAGASAFALPWPVQWAVLAGTLALLVAAVEEAHRLAYQDALTLLPSRRALDERLQRIAGKYTVAMVDVDHFKKFNDRHGHDIGDQILRMVAARLRETPMATAYRYGGEEFTLVFRGKSVEEARNALEEARRRIADRPFVIRGSERPAEKPKRRLFLWRPRQTLSVTVSLGAAERKGWRQAPEEVLKEADSALYKAKKKGRNRLIA